MLGILGRARSQDWRAIVRCATDSIAEELYNELWCQPSETFIGLGLAGGEYDSDQNVLVGTSRTTKDSVDFLIAIGEAQIDPEEVGNYKRVSLVFSNIVQKEMETSRQQWKNISKLNLPMKLFAWQKYRWLEQASINT